MPIPEGYLPRKGDELLVRVCVCHDTVLGDPELDTMIQVEVVGSSHRRFFVDLDKIHSLHCRKWNEGDRVKSIEFDGPGTVLAVSDEWVWVLCETGEYEGFRYTLPANELEPYVEPVAPTETDQLDYGPIGHLTIPVEPG
jgi:hypothetical protein